MTTVVERPSLRLRATVVAAGLAIATASGLLAACGGGSDAAAPTTTRLTVATAGEDRSTTTATTAPDGPVEDYEATPADFANLHTMSPVRGFFVDNKLDHLDEALAIAEANEGGTYPVGTILQLVPQEAMVKRRPGWNPASGDWEFFFLEVSATGTVIDVRGADEVVNRFGGNCASCHAAAEPRFDFVCEDDHGCEPLPIGDDVITAIQEADPRPLPTG